MPRGRPSGQPVDEHTARYRAFRNAARTILEQEGFECKVSTPPFTDEAKLYCNVDSKSLVIDNATDLVNILTVDVEP